MALFLVEKGLRSFNVLEKQEFTERKADFTARKLVLTERCPRRVSLNLNLFKIKSLTMTAAGTISQSQMEKTNFSIPNQPSVRKIQLKNAPEQILVDAHVFDWIQNEPRLRGLNLLENLRVHSSGCAVFQKTSKVTKGQYATETIYFHKLIAEKFLPKTDASATLAGMISENKFDCRIENLVWRSRSVASRLRKTTGKSGYIGVYQESRRFRAVISHHGKAIHIGMYDTALEAAEAYNKYSKELYGDEAKLNKL